MSKAYVFLADGFEEIEGLTVVDILRRGGVTTEMIAVGDTTEVHGSHGITVLADRVFAETDFEDASLLVLPGGMPGTLHLGEHKGLTELLKQKADTQVRIAAICAAPSVLGDLGILSGRKAACYPGFEPRLTGAQCTTQEVAVSGNVTTSRGMGTAIAFALELLGQLKGKECADKMAASIIYRR